MSRAIHNCIATAYQNNKEVAKLKTVSIHLYEHSAEAIGEIIESSGINLNDKLLIKFEASTGEKLEGEFYFNPYKVSADGKFVQYYFDLTGALTMNNNE
jgi:hypothetical protein